MTGFDWCIAIYIIKKILDCIFCNYYEIFIELIL